MNKRDFRTTNIVHSDSESDEVIEEYDVLLGQNISNDFDGYEKA
jgi:hypothetical protein